MWVRSASARVCVIALEHELALNSSIGISSLGPDDRITAYYSSGCKAYALRLQNKQTGKVGWVVKAKGITLDVATSELIHFDAFKVCARAAPPLMRVISGKGAALRRAGPVRRSP